jgi:hypothetical protein
MSLRENWILREVPAVRLICPKPEPNKVLAGRPMLTRGLTSCQGSNCLALFLRKCLGAATGCATIDRSKNGQANVNAIVLRPDPDFLYEALNRFDCAAFSKKAA